MRCLIKFRLILVLWTLNKTSLGPLMVIDADLHGSHFVARPLSFTVHFSAPTASRIAWEVIKQ